MTTAAEMLSKDDPLLSLLIHCSVRIVGASKGSGFFVGPGLVMTCAHVVGEKSETGKTDVQVWYKGEVDEAPVLLDIAPKIDDDLALLSVKFRDHDSVCLGERVKIGDELYAWGFPAQQDSVQIGDGITGKFESPSTMSSGRVLIKFKDAEINSGFSGSALLNRETCRVLGVVTETRGEHSSLGGWAIPTQFALHRFSSHLNKAQDSSEPSLSHWFEVAKRAVKKMISTSFPDLKESPKDNLDFFAKRDDFVERAFEYEKLLKRLQNSAPITLLGSGGSGKSRLAFEVAKALRGKYPDGLWWVPLAEIQEAALVPAEIASRLSIVLPKQGSIQDALIASLKNRKMLLILDNCEHLVLAEKTDDPSNKSPFCMFLEALLKSCAHLKLLATSRVLLKLRDEEVCDLGPMRLPSDLPGEGNDLSAQSEAVALFELRAKKRNQRFSVDEHNIKDVVRICRALGGLPLAIEIAAAQLSIKTVSALAQALDQSLVWKSRNDAEHVRHQTMQSVIQWSYALLAQHAQDLFLSLSVFSGSFSPEACEALHDRDVSAELRALVDHSILMQKEVDSGCRYQLLEPLRQFAVNTLPEEVFNHFAAQHAEWFLEKAKQGDAQVLGADQDAWLHRFEVDRANFRQALNWSMEHDLETALALGANLWRFWEIRSDLQEGFAALETLISKAEVNRSGEEMSRCLSGAGLLAYRQGDAKTALGYFQRVLALERASGDSEERLLRALNDIGIAHQVLGHFQEASAAYEEAIAISEQSENERDVGALYFNLGKLALETEHFEKASAALEKSEQTFREGENDRDLAFPLFMLGLLYLSQTPPQLEDAEDYLDESLTLRQKAQDLRGIADCQNGLGRLESLRGNFKNALSCFKRAFEGHRHIENLRGVSETLEWIALLLHQNERFEHALTLSFSAGHHRARGGFPAPPITEKLQTALQEQAAQVLDAATVKRMNRRAARTEIETLLRDILS